MRCGSGTLLVALALVGAALAGCSDADTGSPGTTDPAARSSSTSVPAPDGPNIVMVLLDDLDAVTMPYWQAMPRTQEWLAGGRVFENAFVSSAECCPSRATILTGNYPHNTGVYDATAPDGGYAAFTEGGAEQDTMATRLQSGGYRTAFIGKYLNGYELDYDEVPPGWDEWFGVARGFTEGYDYEANHNGEKLAYGTSEDDYLTDVIRDLALEELARTETDDDRPFFLAVWTSAPHDAIPPAPRHEGNPFARAELPRGVNFDEPDVSDKPTWLREGQRRLTDADLTDLTRRYRMMMGSLYAVDELVDELFRSLEEQGELDDTYVVFTSDNGYNFGAHRLPHKMVPYEESIRVPMVIVGPGVRAGTDDRLVLTNDLAPSMLDAAGRPHDDLDGRSMLPLLRGEDSPWRDDFLIEYHGTYHDLNTVHTLDDVRRIYPGRQALPADVAHLSFAPTHRAVRSERYLYVEWYGGEEHEYELYDLETDPGQLDNLLADPTGAAAHADLVEQMQARMTELAECAGASCRGPS